MREIDNLKNENSQYLGCCLAQFKKYSNGNSLFVRKNIYGNFNIMNMLNMVHSHHFENIFMECLNI